MSNILFSKVRICDPASSWHGKTADVLVKGKKIISIAKAGSIKADATVKKGGWLSPGWIDFRTYLTDPGYEWKETLDSLARAAVTGGFTRVVCHSATHPPLDHAEMVESLQHRSRDLPVQLIPTGTVSVKQQGEHTAELFDMHTCGALAFSDGIHPLFDSGLLLRTLQYVHPFEGLIMNLPSDEYLGSGGQMHEGEVSTGLGMKGIPDIAEQLMITRDLKLLQYFPGRYHLGPVTTKAGLEEIRDGKKRFEKLSCETSAIYLLLEDADLEQFETEYKVFPPLRDGKNRKALIKAVKDGWVDVISSSHYPQGPEEKHIEFQQAEFGAEGLETAFSAAVTALGSDAEMIEKIVKAMCHRPAEILKIEIPVMDEGSEAELTWFDPEAKWTVSREDIRSRSKNNPLISRELTGKPIGIYSKGKWMES